MKINTYYSKLIVGIGCVIALFIFPFVLNAGGISVKETPENIEAGERTYLKKCQYCHGINGDGDGPAAYFLDPPPRDLTRARYKIISTETGETPTDHDIFKVISEGLRNTSMPGWSSVLSDKDIWQTVFYIKTFAERFDWYKEIKKVPKVVEIGDPPPASKESIERGRRLFMEKLECVKCHGEEGRGDGPSAPELVDEWEYPIKATNLTKPWKFKIGSTRQDIYRAITTGIAGTPMPSFLSGNTKEEMWDVANYVEFIGIKERPQKVTLLKPMYVSGNLPEDIEGPLWDTIAPKELPLFGQILVTPKMYTPSTHEVNVRSVYNDNEIAFLIEWDDINESMPGMEAEIAVDEEEYEEDYVDEEDYEDEEGGDEEEEEEYVVYADAMAIQFPVQIPETPSSPRPFFLMGDPSLPVNLWSWDSETNTFKESNANGVNKKTYQSEEDKDVSGKAVYKHGRYRILIKRALVTSDKEDDIQMVHNKYIPIAFFVWDGHNEETGSQMALSSWYYLFLEKKETGKHYLYSFLAFLSTVVLVIVFIRGIKKEGDS